MATYVFRCPSCSDFDVIQPMSSLTPTHPCPSCTAESHRVFTAPHLATIAPGLHRAIGAADASAEAPQVVRSIPDGAPRPRSRRWNPMTGAAPVDAAQRSGGRYPSLPRS
ncbi:FmdB family zinc ribbon protein [Blastococcus tunisiensis]|uniref:Putative regulatory protein, FmdB family n=1 Tax=Blastococcus tunisiensis TaxID=1798228 RepID=A0A1I2DLG8_9ACTN|nr:FmdB family zinc ribbon protein [Blastococcus sp. DSM 46838]SFE81502.1 putative regulatory protein, FmdB family [Blastococcus sp. DSM 46838]